MGRHKKYGDDLRAKALDLMKAGKSVREAAREIGVPHTTVEKWKSVAAAPPKSEPIKPTVVGPSPDRVRRGSVTPPKESGAGAAAGSGAGGADAARKAAGATAPPQPGAPGAAAADKTPKIPPEMALLMVSGLALQMVTRVYCARFRVKYDDSMKAAAKLTFEEAEAMKEMAPYAAPFAGDLLERYGKYVGLLIYGGLFYMALADRAEFVKGKADPSVFKKKPQEPELDEEAPEDGDDLAAVARRAAGESSPVGAGFRPPKEHPNAPKMTGAEAAAAAREAAAAWSGDGIPTMARDKDGA